MEILFSIFKYLMFGFVGLIVLIVVIAVLFGKRIKKQWEYEADFRDASGREFGEFEIELSRIEKEEPDYTLKAKLKIRHASLRPQQVLQVYIDDLLVVEETVQKPGRIYARTKNLLNPVESVQAGQRCRVVSNGATLFEAEFHLDSLP